MFPSEDRFLASPRRPLRPDCDESPLQSARRCPTFGDPYSEPRDARRIADCGYRSPNSTNHDTSRRDVPDSIDTTFAARRVTRLGLPADLCPQIAPPASKVYRLSVSLRHVAGFPVLGLLRRLRPHHLPSPIAAGSPYPLRAEDGGFPCSGFQPVDPLGGMLYPWWLRMMVSGKPPSSEAFDAPSSRKLQVRPDRTTCPHAIPL